MHSIVNLVWAVVTVVVAVLADRNLNERRRCSIVVGILLIDDCSANL